MKFSTLKVFGTKPLLDRASFYKERPRCEAGLTLHWPKNDKILFFKFLKKSLPALQKHLLYSFNDSSGVAT